MMQGDIAVKRNRNAVICRGKSCLWPKSKDGTVTVPYTLSDNYTSEEKAMIQAAMEEVTVVTCIRFVPRHQEPNYLRIQPYDGCWSYIGRVGGAQELSLIKPRCLHWGIIQHELLHSLGFQHEQCRSDRDKYIRINWGNINQDKERNFYKMSTQNLGMPYDYLSVLHYGKFAFANDAGKPTLEPIGDPKAAIGQRVGLSSLDVVKINKLYGCNMCSYLLPDHHGTFSWDSKEHPNVSTCVWLIRIPEGKVFLQFEKFSVQPSSACNQASVTVYDGMSREAPVVMPGTCGKMRPLGHVASGKLLRIESTSRGREASFKARYNTINCGESFNSSTGNFSSPGFPALYPNSMDCVWVFSAPPGHKITVSIAPISLELSTGCSYDYLLFQDGRRQKRTCGAIPKLSFTSASSSLMVYFHSDTSVQANGFFATYSLIFAMAFCNLCTPQISTDRLHLNVLPPM
ncbi:PREDICTED: astacin-like metalloendopeptidase [Nanorana parkeri]|uniref:astacin-like metalloendopeptidase n=1 Tax=Nanorana parkeri TaxID=125878 RepID=UPI00085494F1|nr:PREDICTED: astacin-like metalloendopeptidase [Nanorana parkeri]